jgi:hypothetical protein
VECALLIDRGRVYQKKLGQSEGQGDRAAHDLKTLAALSGMSRVRRLPASSRRLIYAEKGELGGEMTKRGTLRISVRSGKQKTLSDSETIANIR